MKFCSILLLVLLSGCISAPSDLSTSLRDIKLETAKKWQQECENFFFWREPRITAYSAGHNNRELLSPTVWCFRESRVILRDRHPFDYYSDIMSRR